MNSELELISISSYCVVLGDNASLCPGVIDFNATEQLGVFYDIVYQCQALLNWVCGWEKDIGI